MSIGMQPVLVHWLQTVGFQALFSAGCFSVANHRVFSHLDAKGTKIEDTVPKAKLVDAWPLPIEATH